MFFISGSGRTMCAPMGGMCIQCPLRIINQSVGRDASSRRGETLPFTTNAANYLQGTMLAIVPPAGSCHISHRQNSQISFTLSSTRLIVNLNPHSPLTFHFFPRYTIPQFAQTFWGKAVTACQSKHRFSARWTQRAGGISPGRNLPTSSASAGPPSGKPSLPCVRTAPPLKPLPTAAMLCPTGQTC